MRNKSLLSPAIAVAIFALFAFSGEFQKKPTTSDSLKDSIVMNDSIWTNDSIKLYDMWIKFWDYVNYAKYDSNGLISLEMIALGEKMLEHKYDSVIYEYYAYAHAGKGNSYYKAGDFDSALISVHQAIDLIKEKFGEYHVRLTELNVWLGSFYSCLIKQFITCKKQVKTI